MRHPCAAQVLTMDTDEAWERFSRDTVPVEKSSVTEKLDTLAAAVNDMRTDVERTAQVVPQILGDEAAVDTANAAAGMGAPSGDPLGIGGDVSGGTGMDLAGDAMATNDELPPEMQDASAPPVPSEPAPAADETMPPADAGMGGAPLPEGPAEAPMDAGADMGGDDWTDEDDAFLERILAEAGGDEGGMPEAAPDMGAPTSLRDTFNNALKDAYANAVDSNDSAAIAQLGKLREKIAPLLDEFSAITEGPAEAPAEASIEDAAAEESPEAAPIEGADVPSDAPADDGAPEDIPSEKASEPAPGENKGEDSDDKKEPPVGDKADEKEDESGKDEKKDDKKEDDKVEKSCDDSEAVMDDSIEKDGIGIGDAGAAEALMDEGAAKQTADGGLKDEADTLSGTKKSSDEVEIPAEYGASFAELRKSNGFGAGLLGALIDDAAAEQAPQVYASSVDPMAKGFSDKSEFISSARSIFDMKISTPKDVPDLNDLLEEPEDFPQKDGHQDPAGISDATQPEPSKVNDSDNGNQESTDFADADMERGKNQSHDKVKMPVIKGEEEGRHIMTFREMCRMAKGDRPSLAASTLAGEADDSVAKSSEPVRMGRGVDPMDVIMDDLDAYNIFKEKSEF